ncbi:hypothetical protein HDU96_011100 [Phlyctochytrium bullatum]|nr:hypothetical protein HDU96_011100 [Phlyctochytrium bullatum]
MEFMSPYAVMAVPTYRCPVCGLSQFGGKSMPCCDALVCHGCYYASTSTATASSLLRRRRTPTSPTSPTPRCLVCHRDPLIARSRPRLHDDPALLDDPFGVKHLFRSIATRLRKDVIPPPPSPPPESPVTPDTVSPPYYAVDVPACPPPFATLERTCARRATVRSAAGVPLPAYSREVVEVFESGVVEAAVAAGAAGAAEGGAVEAEAGAVQMGEARQETGTVTPLPRGKRWAVRLKGVFAKRDGRKWWKRNKYVPAVPAVPVIQETPASSTPTPAEPVDQDTLTPPEPTPAETTPEQRDDPPPASPTPSSLSRPTSPGSDTTAVEMWVGGVVVRKASWGVAGEEVGGVRA